MASITTPPTPPKIVLNAHCSAVMWKYCWHVIGKSSGYYIRQTMPSNFSKRYADHFVRGQNWIFSLRCDTRGWLHLGEGRVTEGAVHKSFLDIAASLPQTHFLPASLCLSSKLHNPCQSCLDCRLKVIHKHGRGEQGRMDGGDYNLRCMNLCSTSLYDIYVLQAFTLFLFFFLVQRTCKWH